MACGFGGPSVGADYDRPAMGQSIVVTEKPSSIPGVVRFETNRLLTGMGHERYVAGEEVWGERPPDELARRLFERGGVASVHVNGNMITVDLEKGRDTEGMIPLIEDLYRFYPDDPPAADPEAEESAPEDVAAEEPAAEASTEEGSAGEEPAEEESAS